MTPLRILAIHAHPDDVEILAGGTVLQLIAAGHHVTIATMTPGDCGTTDYPAEQIAAIRRAEAAAAAKLAGADYRCVELRDLTVFNDDASRRRTTETLRAVQPDIVITASPVDYHMDHEATSILVRDSCFAAIAPNYRTGDAPVLRAIPHLYFCDPDEGLDRDIKPVDPHFVIDVSDKIDKKSAMLAAHESQRAWLKRHHGMDDYVETMRTWSSSRGKLVSVAFGEGFRQYLCHPYPRTPLLQDVLAASMHTVTM